MRDLLCFCSCHEANPAPLRGVRTSHGTERSPSFCCIYLGSIRSRWFSCSKVAMRSSSLFTLPSKLTRSPLT
ncbi:uncharacterized protein BT62DRAFT_209728 [Guyanagaster necrorhizus]|uniref:Uncharacterized protein n=1 Tax=Guyanagaster necrorhizus TaxID=856835 RepID=A0A9P7VQS7_9AGAR|nr:uncharacterized protein BT62DRAFT_209728 [Guyanagaster necrorhizus MCA 3950]KAG7445097.1 hypothetical protein BT62DRAFT_209728 [Guyanagaster necrorhizus MCA 3950]